MDPKMIAMMAGYFISDEKFRGLINGMGPDTSTSGVMYSCPHCGATWMSDCMDMRCCCNEIGNWNPNLEV